MRLDGELAATEHCRDFSISRTVRDEVTTGQGHVSITVRLVPVRPEPVEGSYGRNPSTGSERTVYYLLNEQC